MIFVNGDDKVYPIATNNAFSLTKREYFAVMRNEPIFGVETLSLKWAEIIMGSKMPLELTIENIQWWITAHERFSVMRADALIEALNKQP